MNLSAACIVYVLVVLSHCGSDGKLRGNRKRCLFYYVKTSTLLFLSFTLGLVYIRLVMNMDYIWVGLCKIKIILKNTDVIIENILSKKIVTIVLKAKNSDIFAFNFSRFIWNFSNQTLVDVKLKEKRFAVNKEAKCFYCKVLE